MLVVLFCQQFRNRHNIVYLDSLRGIERRPEDPTDLDLLRELLDRSLQDQPANFAERDLFNRALHLVGRVNPPCRELLVQLFVLHRDLETIAEALHLSYDAVRMRVARCLKLANDLLSRNDAVAIGATVGAGWWAYEKAHQVV